MEIIRPLKQLLGTLALTALPLFAQAGEHLTPMVQNMIEWFYDAPDYTALPHYDSQSFIALSPDCWFNQMFTNSEDEVLAMQSVFDGRRFRVFSETPLPELEACGYKFTSTFPEMVLETEDLQKLPYAEDKITVERVEIPEQAETWARILGESYHTSENNWILTENDALAKNERAHRYIAYWEGCPASACMVLLGDTTGGLYYVGTAPEYERKGLGRAACYAGLKDLKDAGYKTVALISFPKGVRLYERFGFKKTRDYYEYVPSQN